jgi:hypothetical protein
MQTILSATQGHEADIPGQSDYVESLAEEGEATDHEVKDEESFPNGVPVMGYGVNNMLYVFDTVGPKTKSFSHLIDIEGAVMVGLELQANTNPQSPKANLVIDHFDVRNDVLGWFTIEIDTRAPTDPEPSAKDGSLDDHKYRLAVLPLPPGTTPACALPASGILASGSLETPRGLAGTVGSQPGILMVELDVPAEDDTSFAIETSVYGATNLPSTVMIPAGEPIAYLYFDALLQGTYDVELRVLDEHGAPTNEYFTLEAGDASSASYPDVEVWLTMVGRMSAAPSTDLGEIQVRRSAFANFATSATSVSLVVNDPNGIMDTLPGQVVIPAGSDSVNVPVTLTAMTGTATVQAVINSEVVSELEFGSVQQGLSAEASQLVVPVNARIDAVVKMAVSEDQSRDLTPSSTNPSVVSPTSPGNWTFAAGACTAMGPLEPASVGAATVQVGTQGLASVSVGVQIVAAETTLARDEILLSNMSGSNGGRITLLLPTDVTFDQVTLPSGAETYVEVTGVGTRGLRLEFVEGESRPASLAIDIQLGGQSLPASEFDVQVADDLRSRSSHRLEMPASQ